MSRQPREYFDFVLCTFDGCNKPYLFRAPAYSGLTRGDVVIVETDEINDNVASVLSCATLGADELEKIDLIMNATGAEDVKKVLMKVVYEGFSYEDEDVGIA